MVLSCVRAHVPTGSSGLVTAEVYACRTSRQKAGAFLYLQKNGRKSQSSVMESELWTVIPPLHETVSGYSFARFVGTGLAPDDGCTPPEMCNWRRE